MPKGGPIPRGRLLAHYNIGVYGLQEVNEIITVQTITPPSGRDKKVEKRRKKVLTNGEWGGILTKLSARAAAGTQRAEKKQDFPKKVLDKASSMWYPR